jgi:hypothetical protein
MRRATYLAVVALCCTLFCPVAFAQDVQVNPSDTNLPNQDNDTTQSETSHAVFGSTIVVAYNDSTQAASLGDSLTSYMSYAYSTNGGANWNYGGLVLPPSGQQIMGDPMVTVDSNGTFYLASLIGPGEFAVSGVAVYQSTATSPAVVFGTPVVVTGINGSGGDKEWLAVDNSGGTYNGRVYIAWSELSSAGSNYVGQIEVAHSTSTSPLAFTAPAALTGTDLYHHGANLAVGPNGEVYLAWSAFDFPIFSGIDAGTIRLLKSNDGGSTWVNPNPSDHNPNQTVATLNVTPNYLTSGGVTIRTRDFPYLAVDTTPAGSATRGNLYLAYQSKTSAASTDNSDIFFADSNDGGATWSTPRTINKGPAVTSDADTTNNDNWQPAISVASTSGQLTVTFYDRREDPANVKIKLYRAVSSDAGMTFFDQPASAVSFQPDTGYDPFANSTYMGDYNFASSGTTTQATWGDLRNLCTPPSGAANPCSPSGRPDMDVFANNTPLLHGPDLFITPWGYVTGVGPVWQTPDIFVVDATNTQVNAEKGIVNLLRARVKNVGDVASSGATITFKYAPWFAGITPAALKTIGTVAQDFTPGQTMVVPINWDLTNLADTNGGLWPAPISTFEHFCVQVTITLASDVNQGNNFAQNNFVDVETGFSIFGEEAFLIGNPFEREVQARLNLKVPKSYVARLIGVPANEPFRLAKNEIKLAVLHIDSPKESLVPKTDQIAQLDFVVDGANLGGVQLRLAKANQIPAREQGYEASREGVFRAALRAVQLRKEGPSFTDEKRGIINSKQVRVSAEELRRLVSPESAQKIGPDGGYYVVTLRSVALSRPPQMAGIKGNAAVTAAVSVKVLLIASTGAYVITGGVPLPSNGVLERTYFEAISRALEEKD